MSRIDLLDLGYYPLKTEANHISDSILANRELIRHICGEVMKS
jgi:hypothetical protein